MKSVNLVGTRRRKDGIQAASTKSEKKVDEKKSAKRENGVKIPARISLDHGTFDFTLEIERISAKTKPP